VKKEVFDPRSSDPFRLSRSKIELYYECPTCFYQSVRLGRSRPSTPGLTLNNAVDELMKCRFDHYRRLQQPDPLMVAAGISGVPYAHPDLEAWQDFRKGFCFTDPRTNFEVMGAFDDLWNDGAISVVDTKAGDDAKEQLAGSYYWDCYRRQMDIYTWLLYRQGFPVNFMSYFIWAQAVCKKRTADDEERLRAEPTSFALTFRLSVVPYRTSIGWIEEKLLEIKECLMSDSAPRVKRKSSCKYCRFRKRIKR